MAYNGPLPQVVNAGGSGVTSHTAYAPICGGTTTTGAVQSASTGISTSGYVLTSNGSSALPSFQAASVASFSLNIQVFTYTGSSQTYTPTSGMVYCIIETVGGGGGGGGFTNPSSGAFSAGAGGGSGEYAQGVFTSTSVGASQTVTIGAGGAGNSGTTGSNGGTTSVGSLISSGGGTGGAVVSTTTVTYNYQAGGAGGTGGSGGSYRFQGGTGGPAYLLVPAGGSQSGYGAGGRFAGMVDGVGGGGGTSSAGNAGTGYGGGGSGGYTTANNNSGAGGAGSAGTVIITEFIT